MWWAQIIKVVVGLAILLALKSVLKAPLLALFGGSQRSARREVFHRYPLCRNRVADDLSNSSQSSVKNNCCNCYESKNLSRRGDFFICLVLIAVIRLVGHTG